MMDRPLQPLTVARLAARLMHLDPRTEVYILGPREDDERLLASSVHVDIDDETGADRVTIWA